MTKHLVVARYAEDVDWISQVQGYKTTIYDKIDFEMTLLPGVRGYPLHPAKNIEIIKQRNIGRESHTFLTHIIKHYHNLPDLIVFTQGYPFDHCKHFLEIINKSTIEEMHMIHEKQEEHCLTWEKNNGVLPIGNQWLQETCTLCEWRQKSFKSIWNYLYKEEQPEFVHGSWGGLMAVAKNQIKTQPYNVYKHLFKLHLRDWTVPWAMELIWPTLFTRKVDPSHYTLL